MNFEQVLTILTARRRLVLSIFFGIVAAIMLLTFILPPLYTATASVVIDAKTDPVAGVLYTDQLLAGYVATQADVISSERVAIRVVKTLKLDEMPSLKKKWKNKTDGVGDIDVWLADYLLDKALTVQTAHESLTHPGNVINIAVKWPDRHLAALLANTFSQAAIETNIELKIEPAKQYAHWFEQRSTSLRAILVERQKRLSDFQNANGIILVSDEKLDVENARLGELSSQLSQIQQVRQESSSRQRQVGVDNESLPEVLQSPLIATLKDNLSAAEARQSDIAGQLGKNHPDYQAAQAEVAGIRARLAQETTKIANSLGSSNQINVRRESDINQALEAQKQRVILLKREHDEAANLESDVAAAQRDLDAVSQRFAQSTLESQAQQTNIVLLSTASEPVDPSSPKVMRNFMISVFLGGVCAIGFALMLEMRKPLVRGDVEDMNALGIPVLGKLAWIKPTSA
jgi:succinoglycan biosynthesis transport protein ExoP